MNQQVIELQKSGLVKLRKIFPQAKEVTIKTEFKKYTPDALSVTSGLSCMIRFW